MNADALLTAALEARGHAHAPYSRYAVGAALQVEDGRIFSGANVENASYGLTICAERSAIVGAASAGARRIVRVVVAATGAPWPCGACRQALAEFCDDKAIIEAVDPARPAEVRRTTLAALLPDAFRPGGPPGTV